MSEEMIGRYRIVAELGRGGMGVVYKAHEQSLNRFVAIKVLGEHLSQDPDYVTRFVREAQSAAKLSHPNIVQIYFIGDDDGKHYFVMEYVSGKSLQQVLRSGGRMEVARATRIVLQAAAGLAAAHDQGVIHRDIKPANLLLGEGNLLKIADFGLALMPDAASRLTTSGMFMGTPGYLSPEQCLDQELDHRTDIYSLGVTYFEMLTGTMPFRADSPLALIKKIAEVEPPSVGDLNPDVDERVRAILKRMMAKDREQRYRDAHELVDALEDYLEATGTRRETAGGGARVVGPPPPPPAPAELLNAAPTEVVETGAGTAPVAPAATDAAGGPAVGTPPPPPIPPSADTPEAGGAPWPDEVPGEAQAESATPMAAAAAPQAGGGRSRVLLVVLVLVVLGVGLLGVAGVVAWRTGLLGRGVEMARAAFGGSRTATVKNAAEPLPDQADVAGSGRLDSGGSAAAEPVTGRDLSEPAPDASSQQVAESGVGAGAVAAAGHSPDVTTAGQPPASSAQALNPGQAPSAEAEFRGAKAPTSPRHETARQAAAAQAGAAAPPPAPARGTALVVTGEPLLAGEVRSFLEQRLGSGGVELAADAGLVGQGAVSPAEVLDRLRGQAASVVLAQVEYLGERQVRYMGRYDTVFQARITVRAYRVSEGSPIGRPYSERIEYTHLNVGDKVERALVGEAADLVTALR